MFRFPFPFPSFNKKITNKFPIKKWELKNNNSFEDYKIDQIVKKIIREEEDKNLNLNNDPFFIHNYLIIGGLTSSLVSLYFLYKFFI